MEGDEVEMSTEELQTWIRDKLETNEPMSSDVLEKFNLLQSLLEKRTKQAAQLRTLSQSVSTCETIVKKQYSLLGWEYKDTDSDDADKTTDGGTTVPSSTTTNGLTPPSPKRHKSENLNGVEGKNNSISRRGEPVVVLTRLTEHEIRSLMPENHDSDEESLTDSGSDRPWEPEEESYDSDFSISNNTTGPNKRTKIDPKLVRLARRRATHRARKNTGAKSNRTKTPTPKRNLLKASTNGGSPVTAFHQSDKFPKTPPRAPPAELEPNMDILARRKAMSWLQGKILEKVMKEDGKLKYKIKFEEKGKSLVSGHHIAFNRMPQVEQLFVGARVVFKFSIDQVQFCPGVLAELPSRKNRMRFLVFIDDQRSIYVGLPLLRLVCQPLNDPLDDIPDASHKNFIKEYMNAWPFPPQPHFRVGQKLNLELNGVVESCVVHLHDCSLIQVLVSTDQRKEWMYRGSPCMEQVFHMKELKKV